MAKEARSEAERLFLDAKGQITNVEIAKKVGAHPITVGKWKQQDDWNRKLSKGSSKPAQKAETGTAPARKKSPREQAFKAYLKAGGKISNKAIADQVGVSGTTISNWKKAEGWDAKLKKEAKARAVERKSAPAPVEVPPVRDVQVIEEIVIDVDALTYPDHISLLNQQISEILGGGLLPPMDLLAVAEAKEAVLQALMAYLEVMDMTSEG